MARIKEQIQIAAPPVDVFRFCHDTEKRTEWDERVVHVELLTSPPIRRGTLIRVDVGRSGKFLFTWEGEYTGFRSPFESTVRVLDAAPSSPFKTGSESWEFGVSDEGARFTLTWEYAPRHWLARIIDALWRRSATRRAIRRSLAKLKALIEAD